MQRNIGILADEVAEFPVVGEEQHAVAEAVYDLGDAVGTNIYAVNIEDLKRIYASW